MEHSFNQTPRLNAAQMLFSRRLRVITEPRRSNKMLRTRTLSELVFMSPRNSPRVTPRTSRFDMDIEISSAFAEGEGTVDLMAHQSNNSSANVAAQSLSELQLQANDQMIVDSDNQVSHDEATPEDNIDAEETRAGRPTGVSEVVDMLFEIHTALKTRHLGQRTAASALAASNLVSTLAYPLADPIPRDEQLEALENTRKMLECAICQELYTNATEAGCCGQIFCKDCIERWVADRGSCPMCREDISLALLSTSRHAQRMANEMKVNCPYCSEVMKKAILQEHISTCEQAPVEPPPPVDVALRQFLVSSARMSSMALQSFLFMPFAPEALMMQCYIRTRGSGQYELYTQDTNTLLCTAVRRRQLDMSVTFSIHLADLSNNTSSSGAQVARLERNFVGSQYTVIDTTTEQPSEIGAVQYAATFGKTPRQMRVALPAVKQIGEALNEQGGSNWEIQRLQSNGRDDTMLAQIENPDATRSISLINKPPVWIESLEAYCLDFGGRVAAASVKNFLLSHPDDMDKTLMLFGRTSDRQVYSMDYRHPFSPVQAFATALSSMDSHLVTFD